MNDGDIRRWPLILTAGLWLAIMTGAGYSQTAVDPEAPAGKPLALDQYTKRIIQSAKKTAATKPPKSAKLNPKPLAARLSKRSAEPAQDTPGVIPRDLPDAVSNANAALTSGDFNRTPIPVAVAIADEMKPAPIEIVSGVQVASADQFNELDQALLDTASSAPALTPAGLLKAASAGDTGSFFSASYDDETWQRASLIGKILIAFGAMLTLGSTLRMMLARRLRS